MSEQAAEAQTDGQQISAVIPASVEHVEHQETPENKPANTHPSSGEEYQGRVDLSSLPEDVRKPVEARFNVLTKKLGNQERRFVSELSEWKKIAEEQSQVIKELQNGVGAVVDHLHDKSLNDAEATIMERLEKAHEAGDTKAFLAAQRDLAKLEAKKTILEERKAAAPAPKQEKPNGQAFPRNAGDMANQAVTDGEIDSEDGRVIGTWQQEKDENGNLVRPWAHSRTPDNPTNDPYYRRALIETAAVFDENSPWADKPVTEKLAEVDRRMGVSRPSGSQTVMGGSLTTQKRNGKITLTSNQERIAIRTKFGGSKAKSDSDHIEAYRKQVQESRAKRGVRQ